MLLSTADATSNTAANDAAAEHFGSFSEPHGFAHQRGTHLEPDRVADHLGAFGQPDGFTPDSLPDIGPISPPDAKPIHPAFSTAHKAPNRVPDSPPNTRAFRLAIRRALHTTDFQPE